MSSNETKPQQLPMDLPVSTALSREDLIASSSNSIAIELIDSWPDWLGPVAILAGPTGSGKSHIGQIWAGLADAVVFSAPELKNANLHISEATNILLEDVSGDELDENSLFHLINHIRAHSKYLLMTTREWPASWSLNLPDLESRLRAAQLVELHEPDDALLKQVLVKLFSDRQLSIEMNVVEYCLPRMERSLESAQNLVAQLDREALMRRTKVTRVLAKQVLEGAG